MSVARSAIARPGILALLVAFALAVGACGGLTAITGPREWTQSSTSTDGTSSTIVVRDTSGRITNVDFDPAGVPPISEPTNPDGNLSVVLVPWTGGACDTKTEITFAAAGQGLAGTIRTETSGEVCIMIAIQHQLRLTLNTPTPAASVTLQPAPVPSQ